MIMLLFSLLLTVALLVGMTIGATVRGWILLPSDRRRLGDLASQLYAEARIDAVTRSTVQAMQDAARERTTSRGQR
jgi:hypothetical protein